MTGAASAAASLRSAAAAFGPVGAALGAAALLLAGCGVSPLRVRRAEDARAAGSADLRKALAKGEPGLRLLAARAMGRVQEQGYAPDLLAALRSPDEGLRAEAAFALGQLRMDAAGEPAQDLTAALLSALDDKSPPARAAAAGALGKSGGPGVEARLAALVADPEPAVSRAAASGLFRLRLLKRISAYAPESVNALLHGIGSLDTETRWRSAAAFSRSAEPMAAAPLAVAAGHTDAWVRFFVLRALAQIWSAGDAVAGRAGRLLAAGEAAAIEAARKAASDPEAAVRIEALGLLKALGAGNFAPAAALGDPSIHVRAAAASALEAGGDARLIESLLDDPSPLARGQAALSLAKRRKDAAWDRIAGLAKDPHWWVRAKVVAAAADLPRFGRAVVEDGLKDQDIRVRTAALEALLAGTGTEALKVLCAVLKEPAYPLELRGTAAEAAARFKGSPEAAGALDMAYRTSAGPDSAELRELVAASAAELGMNLLLEAMLEDPDAGVRARAAAALGRPVPEVDAPEASGFIRPPRQRNPHVILDTGKGEIELELFADLAPVHTEAFLHLAGRNRYAGTQWHRVVSNFVVQGGDPRGTGWGGAGFTLRDETSPAGFERGTVGMPKAGKDTGGGQLFITLAPSPHLDGRYTAFGRVTRGMDVVDRIEPGDLIRGSRIAHE